MTFLFGSIAIMILKAVLYIHDCQSHLFYPMLPACDFEKIPIPPTLHVSLFALFEIYYIGVQFAVFILYADVFTAIVIFGVYLIEQYRYFLLLLFPAL